MPSVLVLWVILRSENGRETVLFKAPIAEVAAGGETKAQAGYQQEPDGDTAHCGLSGQESEDHREGQ